MNSKSITVRLGLLVTVLVTLVISTILSCKKREFLQSETTSSRSLLEKQWVTVSDPRWIVYMLETAKKDNPKATTDQLVQLFVRNTIILSKAQNAIKQQLLQAGGSIAGLDSLNKAYKQSIFNTLKSNPNFKPAPLDTAKWNTYLALALPKRVQAKTMYWGGDLGGVTITACEIPDDLQAFAGSPEIVRQIMMMYMGSHDPVDACKYRACKDLIDLYDSLLNYTGDGGGCGELRQRAGDILGAFYNCDAVTSSGGGEGSGSDGGNGDPGSDDAQTTGTFELDGNRDPDFPSNCASWAYESAAIGTYQSCGVSDLRVDYITTYQIGNIIHIEYVRMHFDKTLYFEFPRTRADGTFIGAGEAARLTAQAKDAAEDIFESQVESSPPPTGPTADVFLNRYLNILKAAMERLGGRVTYKNNYGTYNIMPYTKGIGGC